MQLNVARGWGRKVKEAREQLGLSQVTLAQVCEVDPSTISRIERGSVIPSDRVKWLLAGALNKTVDDLFAYPAVQPPAPAPHAESA